MAKGMINTPVETAVFVFAVIGFMFTATLTAYMVMTFLDDRVFAPRRRRKRGY